MNQNFYPEAFFDLKDSPFAALFLAKRPVWEALPQIKVFLSNHALGQIHGEIEPGAYLIEPERIYIGKGSRVESGAYIRGPCYIGEGCEIRHGAYLRGQVLVGHGAVVGHASEVKNSILLNDAKAAHFAYLGDAILGARVNLGAGVKCANLRLDGLEIEVGEKGARMKTGLRKLGAIIGDDSELGCNSVTNPGTLIGKNCMCYPGLVLSGSIKTASIIKGK